MNSPEVTAGKVADVVEIPPKNTVTVDVAIIKLPVPQTSQSPALKLMEVMFAVAPVVKLLVEATTEIDKYSPTLRVAALLFVVVPMIPDVELNNTWCCYGSSKCRISQICF